MFMTAFRSVVVGSCAVAAMSGLVVMRSARGHAETAIDPAERRVVVAELFTSEGCSSCPPADDLLTRLVSTQPVPQVEIVALGEHVDYWDGLGWRDPFSSHLFTSRQSDYVLRVFRTGNVYTPQLVIDGADEAIGSDDGAARHAIASAAKKPKADVSAVVRARDANAIDVVISIRVPPAVKLTEPADVVLAIAESHLVTHVRRGENGGRTLTHSAVVRSLTPIAVLDAGRTSLEQTASLPLQLEWKRENLRVVTLLQARESRRIVGAMSSAIPDIRTSMDEDRRAR